MERTPDSLHFVVQIVALARALADAGEYRQTAVLLGDVVNQLHDQNRFANACAAEQTDFAALRIRADQVDDLDAGFENFGRSRQFVVFRRGTMNVPMLAVRRIRLIVHRFAENVENAPQRLSADGNGDSVPEIRDHRVARQTVGRSHCDAANGVVADMLRNLDGKRAIADRHGQGIVNRRHCAVVKAHVHNRSHDLRNDAQMLVFQTE